MKIYAHRGFSSRFPEGTRAAYEGAVIAGADGFECDVRLSRDNQIICFHDRTIKRIAGVRKAVSRLTAQELHKLVNSITLNELLDIALEEKKDLLIETKHPVLTSGKIERRVLEILGKRSSEIEEAGINITIMSFSYLAVYRLKGKYPDVAKVIKYSIPARMSRAKTVALNIELIQKHPRIMRKLKAEKILVWTVNTSAGLQRVKDEKIAGVITDKPRFARKKLIG
jgi:glycerophosphoryl diester phosphodiesterase